MKVLHVDDEAAILEQAKIFLEKEVDGFHVTTATSAEEGLDLLEEDNFDAVVSDYQMPEMDGLEFLEVVREDRDNDVPFIVFTGKGREEVAVKALNLGADRYLQKGGSPKSQYGVLAQAIVQEVHHYVSEKDLQESEERYRRLFETAQDGMIILDAESGKIKDANPYIQGLTGYSKEELVGKELWQIGTFEDVVENKKRFDELVEEGFIRYKDLPIKTKKGEERTVEFVSNTYEAGGEKVVQCNIRDVSERKKAEEKLERERDRAQRYLETAEVMMVSINQQGKVIQANRKASEVLGYDKEDIIGENWFENFVPEEDREEIRDVHQGVGENEYPEYYESPVLTKSGDVRTILWHNSTLKEEEGNVNGTLSSGIDITERKELEEKARRNRERLERSQKIAKVGSWEIDLENGDLSWSDETYRIFDVPIGESISYDEFLEFIHPEDRDYVDEKWNEALETGEYDIEHRILIDGETKWVREKADIRFDDGGEPVEAIGSVQDITDRKEKEEKLRESERKFRESFKASPDPVFLLDEDGVFVDVNETALQILGFEEEEIVGSPIRDAPFFPEETVKKTTERFERRKEGEEIPPYTVELETKDGDRIITEVNVGTFEKEGFKGEIVIGRDITERKEMEEELKEREKKFQSLTKAIPEVFWLTSVEDFEKIEYVSPAFEEIWGDKPEELYRNPRLWTDKIHEEDKDRVIESFENLVEKGKKFDVEFRIVRDDGSIRWIRDQGFPVYDSEENLVRLAGLAQDITEEKRLEERFEELFNANPDPIILIDKNGVVREVNQAAVDVIGYDAKEIIGKSITEVPFISPESKEKIAEKFKKRLQSGESSPYTIKVETKEGEQLFAEINATLIDKKGKPAQIIAVVRDITDRKEMEEELSESEERFRSLFESSRDAVMTLKPPEWEFNSANPSAVEMFKAKDEDDFCSRPPWEYSPERQPDGQPSKEKAKKMIDKAMSEGEAFFEWTHKQLDGEEFPATVLLSRVEAGEESFLQATVRDITERKEAEGRLKESEEKFRSYVENAPNGVFVADKDGNYLEVNKTACEMTGYSEEELLEMNISELVTSEAREKALETFGELLETGEMRTELPYLRKDGSKRYWSINAVKLSEDHYLGFTEDITKRKKAEKKLEESEERFKDVMYASQDAILLIEDNEFVDCNEATAEMLGYDTLEEVLQTHPSELSPPTQPDGRDSSEKADEMIRQAFEQGYNRFEWVHQRANGENFPVEVSLTPIVHKGKRMLYCVWRDITEQKRIKEREEFLHTLLRHDVRNKSQIVQGYLELLEDFDLSEDAREYLKKGKRGIQESMDIIEKVRMLRKAEEEKVETVRIESIVESMVEENRSKARKEEMEIEMNCPEFDCKVQAGSLLKEVFTNLVGNSIRHSGGSKIRISGRKSGDEIVCTIEDNGKGIPDADKEKIFEKGYTTDEKRGTGIGLFLVKRLLDIYNGGIEVKDSEMGGARFDIHLRKSKNLNSEGVRNGG